MTPVVQSLREYETVVLSLDDTVVRRLAATDAVMVAPGPRPGEWAVTAQHFVGSIVLEGLQLLIRPKIEPENLFLMLEVGLPERAWRREAFDYATHGDLLPAVIAFFARTVETTLARGLLRSYRAQAEPLVTLRGRIDVAAQVRRGGVEIPVACRYDDFTPDIVENRYLKTAIRRTLRVALVLPEDRRRLMQELATLEDVSDAALAPDVFDRIGFTRLNVHYEPALRLARLILENLTLVDQRGRSTASSFLVDMNQLFEDFVTARLRRALRDRLEVVAQHLDHLSDGRRAVPIRPDLVFRRRGMVKFVGDVKYKLTGTGLARNADYYQLLAYTTALNLPEGVLIYCLADGGRPERSVTVRHSGKVLHTRALDLTGSPASVASEIELLADWIADRAGSTSVASSAIAV